MIHIHSKGDVVKVKDVYIRQGLEQEFDRLPNDFVYPEYGYFIVIESIEELRDSIPLAYGDLESTPTNLLECIEMVEQFEGYSQIVCILYSDFGVSLFVSNSIDISEFIVRK